MREHDVAEGMATLLRLHERQWRGRGVTTEHMRPRFAEHLTRAATRMVRTGDAQVTEYRLDGETVAANITLLSAAMSGGYLYGADPGLRSKADITTMLLRHEAGQAARDGRAVLSMLRGCEPHKRHWRPEEVVNGRLLLARRELGPTAGPVHRTDRRAGAGLGGGAQQGARPAGSAQPAAAARPAGRGLPDDPGTTRVEGAPASGATALAARCGNAGGTPCVVASREYELRSSAVRCTAPDAASLPAHRPGHSTSPRR